jgi:hypothetical protein
MRRVAILIVVLAVALVSTATATPPRATTSAPKAAKPHSPRNGATIKYGRTSFMFDWRWGQGQYRGAPYISRYPDMRKPQLMGNWVTASHSGPFIIGPLPGYPGSEPKAIGRYKAPLTGKWYWQVCAVSIHGEDDKCKFSGPIYHFTVVR